MIWTCLWVLRSMVALHARMAVALASHLLQLDLLHFHGSCVISIRFNQLFVFCTLIRPILLVFHCLLSVRVHGLVVLLSVLDMVVQEIPWSECYNNRSYHHSDVLVDESVPSHTENKSIRNNEWCVVWPRDHIIGAKRRQRHFQTDPSESVVDFNH